MARNQYKETTTHPVLNGTRYRLFTITDGVQYTQEIYVADGGEYHGCWIGCVHGGNGRYTYSTNTPRPDFATGWGCTCDDEVPCVNINGDPMPRKFITRQGWMSTSEARKEARDCVVSAFEDYRQQVSARTHASRVARRMAASMLRSVLRADDDDLDAARARYEGAMAMAAALGILPDSTDDRRGLPGETHVRNALAQVMEERAKQAEEDAAVDAMEREHVRVNDLPEEARAAND
jgi:hypothetical protein